MMKNDTIKIYCLLFLLIGSAFSALHAQDDFTTWTSMKVSHSPFDRFTVSGKFELRTKDSMKSWDRWGVGAEAGYQLFPFLKAEAGYELHHRNRGGEGWKFRHRYGIGATGSVKWGEFKFSLRERFQQTINKGDAENRLRSRLKIAYAPQRWIVSPYFSGELYQAIGDAAFWEVARMRYRPGVEIKLPHKWKLDVFYCYQYQPDKSKHIAGVECSFAF